jgi:enamine deaminase RidA (YjgF/YER057c/UK114 family)
MTSAPQSAPAGRVEYLNPEGLHRNPAFTNVAVVSGPVRTIYVGGQDAVTADGQIVGKGDLAGQTAQILSNVETALAAAGAPLEHVVKDAAAVVKGLAHPDFLAEIDAIAVVPE